MSNATRLDGLGLPATGFLRLHDIVGRPARAKGRHRRERPAIPAIFPVSRSTWWAGVRSGRYPPPIKIGRRCTAWKVEDIRMLLEAKWDLPDPRSQAEQSQ